MEQDEPNIPEGSEEEASMRLENDIMKLKLQAEFGAQFDEISKDVSPEVEQQFLKQVYDFEKAWEQQEATTVGKLLGNPSFKPFDEIPAKKLAKELQCVLDLYQEKGISVDFTNEYPLEVKYRFATEELPAHETMFVNMPGMMLGFIYEEFHPNHASDMEDRVKEFLEGWFEQNVEKCAAAVSKEFILDNGEILSCERFIERLKQLFDSFEKFDDTDFFIAETSYDKQELEDGDEHLSLGYVEGGVTWKAVMETGEIIPFAGPFKFYLECSYDYWTIMYFQLPGWKWQVG